MKEIEPIEAQTSQDEVAFAEDELWKKKMRRRLRRAKPPQEGTFERFEPDLDKGLTRAQATARHALKNAMVPILPMIIGSFISVMSGSMIIERIFSIPGVGQLYIQAINQFDYDVFMIDCIFYSFVGLLAGIVVDLSYGFIDPRIRMGEK